MGSPSEPSTHDAGDAITRLRERLASTTSVQQAAEATVDAFVAAGIPMPSIYVEHGGRLRCVAVRGYWQILDGIAVDQGVAGRTFRTGQPSIVPDVRESADFLDAVPGVEAEVCLPVRHAGEVCGILNVEANEPLSDDQVAFTMACAAEFERRMDELGGPPPETPWRRFARFSGALNSCETTEEVVGLGLDAACKIAGLDSAMIALGGKRAGDGFRIIDAIGPLADDLRAIPSEGLANIASWTGKASAVYTFGDVADRGFLGHSYLRDAGVGAIAAVALMAGGRSQGFLLAASVAAERPTTEQSERFELLAAHVGSSLQNVESLNRLRRQAQRDSLTELGHNASFHAALAAEAAEPSVEPLGVYLIDLDGFKQINDSVGHVAGDGLLTQVARSLASAVRGSDRVFRIGGDEFAALVPVADEHEAVAIGERLCAAVRACEPMTASVGIGLVDRSTRRRHEERARASRESTDTMIVEADLALYEAKRTGRDRPVLFYEGLRATLLERARLAADLAGAIERGELFLAYQPVMDLRANMPLGVEALVRWQHPRQGLIGPLDFIPVAEEDGQIAAIGRWVLKEAARQGAEWNEGREQGFMIGVNISGTQVRGGLVEEVADVLAATGLAPNRLVLEMTESTLIDNPDGVTALRRLRAMGVHLAIDDFGTGYSSLAYLRDLPIDILKIDKSFVATLDDPRNEAVARAIIELGRTLDLGVVAEGIETAAQEALLRSFGCPFGQGYRFARPGPAEQVAQFLTRDRAAPHSQAAPEAAQRPADPRRR